jgi:hypothetical protein
MNHSYSAPLQIPLKQFVNCASPLCVANVTWHLVTQDAGQHYTRECWDLTLLPHCPTSSWSVRFWVSGGRATTKIPFHYLTESTRGGEVCWVWDYTGSCRSTYRPPDGRYDGMWVPDTACSCVKLVFVVGRGAGGGGIFWERQTRNICEPDVKIFVTNLDAFKRCLALPHLV